MTLQFPTFRRFAATASLLALTVLSSTDALAALRKYDMNIEDTRITLVEKQQFHTFAFSGQVPGPLFYVDEGDQIEVNVNNVTALPHTVHWHGMLQKGTWKMDGVPGTTQPAIAPGETFTYKFTADPSGTMWYHCHVTSTSTSCCAACGARSSCALKSRPRWRRPSPRNSS